MAGESLLRVDSVALRVPIIAGEDGDRQVTSGAEDEHAPIMMSPLFLLAR